MSRQRLLFYDTCFYIDLFRGQIASEQLRMPSGPLLVVGHGIVLMELYQGVRSDREEKAVRDIESSVTLLSPSLKNYLEAGRILKKMTGEKSLLPKRLYETQNDLLLALSAVEHNAWIVTRNRKDFEKIQKHCPVSVVYY